MAKKNKDRKTSKRNDFIILLALLGIMIPINLIFHFNYLFSAFSFFLIPALFLSLIKPKSLRRITVASLVSLPALFTFDIFITINKGWYIPTDQLLFPLRIFNIVPIDDMLWFSCWVLFITTFYEHFIDHDRSDKISKYFPIAVITMLISFVGMLFLFFVFPQFLHQQYAYFTLLLFCIPIPLAVVLHNPKLFIKFLLAIAFFVPVFFMFELIGLSLHEWTFPGYYIGHIALLSYSFPFEEFALWIVLSTAVVLSYYELFIDDDK